MSMSPRVLIHYWTTTFNTRLAAELAAAGLRAGGAEVEVRDMRRGDFVGVRDVDLWVVAAPVYAFRLALAVEDALRSLTGLGGVRAAAVLTCAGWADRTPGQMARLLRAAGAEPWDWRALRCEDAWPVARKYLRLIGSFGEPGRDARAAFQAWWQDVPRRLAAGDPGRRWRGWPTPLTLLSLFYGRRLVRHWFPIRVDTERCTTCGQCVRLCPTGRMQIDHFPRPQGDCIGCYGCVNVCPVNAVNTYLTHTAPRYRGPADF